jgi:hypothetical protein
MQDVQNMSQIDLDTLESSHRSYGWERLSVREVAEYHRQTGGMVGVVHVLEPKGLHIQDCPECETSAVFQDHDYICYLCRHT